MTRQQITIIAAAIFMAVPLVWIRVAPTDPARWHVAPESVARVPDKPRQAGWLVREGAANAAPPVFATDPGTLLAAFDELALSGPRTRRIAGAPEAGLVTYLSRTPVFGFPDFASVAAREAPGGAVLEIWSRNRFGGADLGVNRRRVEGWVAALSERLPRGRDGVRDGG